MPGPGLVAASESCGRRPHGASARSPAPAPGARRTTTDEPVSWTDPRAWTPRTWDTVTVDADRTRPGRCTGRRRPACTPVLTSSGLVVRALQPPDDLVATTPEDGRRLDAGLGGAPGRHDPEPRGVRLGRARDDERAHAGRVLRRRAAALAGRAARDRPERAGPGLRRRRGAGRPVRPRAAVRHRRRRGALAARALGADVNRAPAVGAGLVVVADRRRHRHRARRGDRGLRAGTGPSRPRPSPWWATGCWSSRTRTLIGLDPATGHDPVPHPLRRPAHGAHRVRRPAAGRLQGGDACCSTRTGGSPPGCPATSRSTRPQTHLVGWTADRLDVARHRRARSSRPGRPGRPRWSPANGPASRRRRASTSSATPRAGPSTPGRPVAEPAPGPAARAAPGGLARSSAASSARPSSAPSARAGSATTAGRTGCGRWSLLAYLAFALAGVLVVASGAIRRAVGARPERQRRRRAARPRRSGCWPRCSPSGSACCSPPGCARRGGCGCSRCSSCSRRSRLEPADARARAGRSGGRVAGAGPARRAGRARASSAPAGRSPGGSSARSGRSARRCLVVGLVENRYSIDFGSDQVPLLLQYLAVDPRLPRAADGHGRRRRRSPRSACG